MNKDTKQKNIENNSRKNASNIPELLLKLIGISACIIVLIVIYLSPDSLLLPIVNSVLAAIILLIEKLLFGNSNNNADPTSTPNTEIPSQTETGTDNHNQDIYTPCICAGVILLIMITIDAIALNANTDNTDYEYKALEKAIVSTPNGTIGGHGYIDLGLSVKWGAYNIGVKGHNSNQYKPSEIGEIYAWSDTTAIDIYKDKSNISESWTYKGLGDISGSPHDIARIKRGATWRMPTKAEWQELIEKCQWKKAKLYNTTGFTATGPNGNSIFLPTDIIFYGDNPIIISNYWSSTPYEQDSLEAYTFSLYSNEPRIYSSSCKLGFAIRAVTD